MPVIEEKITAPIPESPLESAAPVVQLNYDDSDVLDSDDELIPVRTRSFGKKMLAKGCLCYSGKSRK